jgi:hypothetical protein
MEKVEARNEAERLRQERLMEDKFNRLRRTKNPRQKFKHLKKY